MTRSTPQPAPPTNKDGLLLGLVLSVLAAAIVSFAAPRFADVLIAFGADLPWFTRVVLKGYLATWLLPAGVVAVWLACRNASLRRKVVLAIGLLGIGGVLPVCLIALYLPIFKLSATM